MSHSDDHLRTYFLAMRKALNRDGLGAEVGAGTRAVRDWLAGRRPLPENTRPKVEAWARFFGYDPDRQYDQII